MLQFIRASRARWEEVCAETPPRRPKRCARSSPCKVPERMEMEAVEISPDPIDFSKLRWDATPVRRRRPGAGAKIVDISITPGLEQPCPPSLLTKTKEAETTTPAVAAQAVEPDVTPTLASAPAKTANVAPAPARRRLRRKMAAPTNDGDDDRSATDATDAVDIDVDVEVDGVGVDADADPVPAEGEQVGLAARSLTTKLTEPRHKRRRRLQKQQQGQEEEENKEKDEAEETEETPKQPKQSEKEKQEEMLQRKEAEVPAEALASGVAPPEAEPPKETPVRRRSLQLLEVTPEPISKEEADFREHLSQRKRQLMQKMFASGSGGIGGRNPKQDFPNSSKRRNIEEVPPLPLLPDDVDDFEERGRSRSRDRRATSAVGRDAQFQQQIWDLETSLVPGQSSSSPHTAQSGDRRCLRFETPTRLEGRRCEHSPAASLHQLSASPAPSSSSSCWPPSGLRGAGTPSLLKRPRSRPPSEEPASCLVSSTPSRSVLRGLPHPELLKMALQLESRYL